MIARVFRLRPATVLAALLLVGGCRPTGPAVGKPIGKPTTLAIGAAGGTLTSDDGQLTVTIPPGALAATTDLTVTTITNVSPGGVGNAYRLQPDGTTFATPVTVTFTAPPSVTDLSGITIAYQIGATWLRLSGVLRDITARTLAVGTSHFSDWALVGTTTRDLFGSFTYTSTIGLPFTATGSVALSYAGEDAIALHYLPSGTITVPDPIPFGTTSCHPVAPVYTIHPSLIDVVKSTSNFQWGINGEWKLTCDDGMPRLIATAFDTYGINQIGCLRGYVTAPLVTATQLAGDYRIDCGTNGYVEASWSFSSCTADTTCTSPQPCKTAAIVCETSGPTCEMTGNQPNGTSCGTGMTCNAGACVQSGTVTGTRLATYWPDSGPLAPVPAPDVATAPPRASVQAFVPAGSGGWAAPSYYGSFATDGSFSIPNLPTGPFLLVLTDGTGLLNLFDGVAGGPIDLGYDTLGRPDVRTPTGSTPVTFALTGIVAWNAATDQLQMTSSNADVWDVLNASGVVAPAGNAIDDWFASTVGGVRLNLLTASDTLYVHQLAGAIDASSAYPYLSVSAWTSTTGVSLADQVPATVAPPAFVAPATTASTTGTWSLSSFQAQLPLMAAAATTDATAHSLVIGANVCTSLTTAGPSGRASPTLLSMRLPTTTAPDPLLGTLTYGEFLDASWKEWRAVDLTAHVVYMAPGAVTGVDETVSLGRREPMPATTALAPTVTPVQNATIAGASAFGSPLAAPLTATGTTPILAWAPPATGTPTFYTVEFFQLANAAGTTTRAHVATWYTTSTQVTPPPGLLQAGGTYYARITAVASPLAYSAAAPLRAALSFAYAALLTTPFST